MKKVCPLQPIPSQPIFKEEEINGIYTATLNRFDKKGLKVEFAVQMDLQSMQDSEIKRLMYLKLDLKTIFVRTEIYLSEKKRNAISDLNNDFNQRINY